MCFALTKEGQNSKTAEKGGIGNVKKIPTAEDHAEGIRALLFE